VDFGVYNDIHHFQSKPCGDIGIDHGFARPWAECIPSAPPDTGAAQAAQALTSQLMVSGQRRYGCIDLSFEDQWLL